MSRPDHAVRVELTRDEMEIAEFIAKRRQEEDEAAGIVDKLRSNKPSIVENNNGMYGEMAGGKYFDRYPDFSTQPRKGGHDFIVGGARVDAKAISNMSHDLCCKLEIGQRPRDVDIYLLVQVVDVPVCELWGWCYFREIIRPESIQDRGHGPTYWRKPKELNAVNWLLEDGNRWYRDKVADRIQSELKERETP